MITERTKDRLFHFVQNEFSSNEYEWELETIYTGIKAFEKVEDDINDYLCDDSIWTISNGAWNDLPCTAQIYQFGYGYYKNQWPYRCNMVMRRELQEAVEISNETVDLLQKTYTTDIEDLKRAMFNLREKIRSGHFTQLNERTQAFEEKIKDCIDEMEANDFKIMLREEYTKKYQNACTGIAPILAETIPWPFFHTALEQSKSSLKQPLDSMAQRFLDLTIDTVTPESLIYSEQANLEPELKKNMETIAREGRLNYFPESGFKKGYKKIVRSRIKQQRFKAQKLFSDEAFD